MVNIKDIKSGEVKLEFGNMYQIKTIDEAARLENLEAAEKDNEILKTYRCIFYASGSAEIDVDAFDAEEAARDMLGMDDVEWEDWEHHDIQLIGIAKDGEE